MSWLSEAWKDQIPPEALANIVEMEERLEKSLKDLSQYQFKTESLEGELQNAKSKLEEKTGEIKTLEREVSSVNNELGRRKSSAKSVEASLQNKDNIISDSREEINRLKTDLSEQRMCAAKLTKELETLTNEQEETNNRQNNDVGRLTELKILNEQRVEELKQEVENMNRSKLSVEASYEQKIEDLLKEISQDKNSLKTLNKEISAMDIKYQTMEGEQQSNQAINDSHLAKIGKLQQMLNDKTEQIERMKIELKKKDIGDYLGIDVRKICSDSSVCAEDYSQLITQNKILLKQNDQLQQQLIENNAASGSVTAGAILKSAHVQCSLEPRNDEVVVSRLVSGNQSSNVNVKRSNVHVYEYESEMKKLKEENAQMHQIYENHMKICSNNIRIARKSSSTFSQSDSGGSATEAELRRRIHYLEQAKEELERTVACKNKECVELYQQIARLQSNEVSDNAMHKLEDLVDVIMQQKGSNMSNNLATSSAQSLDMDSLKSSVYDRIASLQEELLSDCKTTRESIKNNTKKILSVIHSHQVSSQRSESRLGQKTHNSDRCLRFETKSQQQPPLIQTSSGNHCLDELETIRGRLDYLQQSVYDREGEFRRVQKDRDCIQGELVKLMELMKKKDEELSRISCLFELEKQKVNENDSCYRAEMEALKVEQLEIYKEFRDMCDNLKRKDIELLNKTKQMKLLNAEWREKEDELNERVLSIEKDLCCTQEEKSHLQDELGHAKKENATLLSRLNQSEEQLQLVYDNLSRVEDIMFKAKGDGLYH